MRSPAGRVRAAITALALSALALTGCAGSDEPAEPSPQQSPTASSAPSAKQRTPAEGTTGTVTVTDDSVILGDPDAPERVHIYQDLNCPHCQVLHGLMAEDVANWAQGDSVAVEVTVVDYLGPRTTHAFSTRGANLLALVADVDPEAWPAVQDALLAMQPSSTTEEVTTEQLIEAARGAGAELDEDDVAAQEGLAYAQWVDAATAGAAAAGVNYIPQVWIDGELVGGESHDETLELVRQAVSD